MKISELKAAQKRSAAGAWVKDIAIEDGVTVDIRARSIRNPAAAKIRSEMVAALTVDPAVPLPESDKTEILVAVLADTVVLDWNLTDEGGKKMPCSPEKVRAVLTDPEIGEAMRTAALYAGSIVAERGVAALEAAAKN